MDIYRHKVQYYETDQMKVVHHSNYIRWFEEGRTHLMSLGEIPYCKMEDTGIICPVLSVNAAYKSMTRFEDVVDIGTTLKVYNGVKMEFEYRVTDSVTGELRCTGSSTHCFVDEDHRLLNLKKSHPEIHLALQKLMEIA